MVPYQFQVCLCQTLQEMEFVCVDDGSTDGSSAILQSYRDRDGRFVIIQQPNRGHGVSINNGIRHAHGEYIGIVESDDASYRADYLSGRYDRTLWNTRDREEACRILEDPEAYLSGVKRLLEVREAKRQEVLQILRNESFVYIYGAWSASYALRVALLLDGADIRGFVTGASGGKLPVSGQVFDAQEIVRDDPLILVPVRQSSQTGLRILRTDKGWRVIL